MLTPRGLLARRPVRVVLASLLSLAMAGALVVIGARTFDVYFWRTYGHADMIADFSIAANLVEHSDDIFVGRVVEQLGAESDIPRLPRTQFAVDVETVIKGDVDGVVTVDQVGGTRLFGLELVLLFGDRMLEPGSRYLFATSEKPRPHGSTWNVLIPVSGDVLLVSNEQERASVERLRAAVRAE